MSSSKTNHSHELCLKLQDFYSRSILFDVTLHVDGCRISAHKLILGAFSGYFEAMFSSEMQEARSNVINLSDIDPTALKKLVDYMYSGNLDVYEENVESMLSCASMLQMPDIVEKCCKKLESLLDSYNCIGIWLFAEARGCTDLASVAMQHVLVRYKMHKN